MSNTMSTHIDKMVLRLFLVAFLVSASVLAYRATNYSPCKEVKIEVKTKDLVEGKLITFTDNTDNATSWEWNFGDSSKVVINKEALHVYNKPGKYNVSLMVNGICKETKEIIVKEKPFVIDSTKLAVFNLPRTIKVGKKLVVVDKTLNATTWEWRFGETAGANSTKKVAKYVYETPGLKTVSLVVNGDIKHATSKKIEVLPLKKQSRQINTISAVKRTVGDQIKDAPSILPLGKKDQKEKDALNDAPKTVPFISESQFKNKLILVSRKKVSANTFKKYLCGDLNKSIIVNGAKTTFLEFCELIKIKKVKIKEVKLYRDDNNCITNITIKRSKYIL